jgi:hypothetical protein
VSDLSPRSAAARLGALTKWGAPKADIDKAKRDLALANAAAKVARAADAVKEAKTS